MSNYRSNRFKYIILINGDVKGYFTDLRTAVKEAEYYRNNIQYYGWADISVCQILITNGEEVR